MTGDGGTEALDRSIETLLELRAVQEREQLATEVEREDLRQGELDARAPPSRVEAEDPILASVLVDDRNVNVPKIREVPPKSTCIEVESIDELLGAHPSGSTHELEHLYEFLPLVHTNKPRLS